MGRGVGDHVALPARVGGADQFHPGADGLGPRGLPRCPGPAAHALGRLPAREVRAEHDSLRPTGASAEPVRLSIGGALGVQGDDGPGVEGAAGQIFNRSRHASMIHVQAPQGQAASSWMLRSGPKLPSLGNVLLIKTASDLHVSVLRTLLASGSIHTRKMCM